MEPTVADLLAKQEITEQLYRYCRALDRFDKPMAMQVWHEDATADYGDDIFQGTGEGFVEWVWPVHEHGFTFHSHQITNVLIDVRDDTAVSEAYVTVWLRPVEGDDLVDRGRYLDRWERRDGRWAIVARRYVSDMSGMSAGASRGPDDPSWELFG